MLGSKIYTFVPKLGGAADALVDAANAKAARAHTAKIE
jgi:hypothetical protein